MSLFSDMKDLAWSDWLYTIISAAIGAAATTIAANPIASVLGAQQFTPRQLGILAASSALVAVAGVLRKSPLPDRRKIEIALIPGVHDIEQVERIAKITSGGAIPTPEAAAAMTADMPKPPSPDQTK